MIWVGNLHIPSIINVWESIDITMAPFLMDELSPKGKGGRKVDLTQTQHPLSPCVKLIFCKFDTIIMVVMLST